MTNIPVPSPVYPWCSCAAAVLSIPASEASPPHSGTQNLRNFHQRFSHMRSVFPGTFIQPARRGMAGARPLFWCREYENMILSWPDCDLITFSPTSWQTRWLLLPSPSVADCADLCVTTSHSAGGFGEGFLVFQNHLISSWSAVSRSWAGESREILCCDWVCPVLQAWPGPGLAWWRCQDMMLMFVYVTTLHIMIRSHFISCSMPGWPLSPSCVYRETCDDNQYRRTHRVLLSRGQWDCHV